MKIEDLSIEGLKVITPDLFEDERGLFYETYRYSRYAERGIKDVFVQDNCSISEKGCIRGMHYQEKPGQGKLVSVIQGEIFDVAVDIRENSPTYGKWEAITLNDLTRQQIYIPIGFAHGFCVLSEQAIVNYKVTSDYNGKQEKGFRYDDPSIEIQWPIDHPTLSERDQRAPYL